MIDIYPISINVKIPLNQITLKNLKNIYILNEVIKIFPKSNNIIEQQFQYEVLKKIKKIKNFNIFLTKKKKINITNKFDDDKYIYKCSFKMISQKIKNIIEEDIDINSKKITQMEQIKVKDKISKNVIQLSKQAKELSNNNIYNDEDKINKLSKIVEKLADIISLTILTNNENKEKNEILIETMDKIFENQQKYKNLVDFALEDTTKTIITKIKKTTIKNKNKYELNIFIEITRELIFQSSKNIDVISL